MKRYLVQTMGCQMNVHDSRRIEEVLRASGWARTDEGALADLIVFNTCSVREKAEHKLMSALGTVRPFKDERHVVVAVAGCVAQQEGERLLSRAPFIDIVVGPDNIPELPALVANAQGGAPPIARTVFDLDDPRFLNATPHPSRLEVTSFVTVMKGCDERCTFCIVPYTRGPERYRSASEIVSEIRTLAEGGVREVTLLGQTVNSWHEPGGDTSRGSLIHSLSRRPPGGAGPSRGRPLLDDASASPRLVQPRSGPTALRHARSEGVNQAPSEFASLLRRIAAEVPSLARLRYTSPHPRHLTDELIRAHAELPMLPRHVHLPVQSGSNRMLKRMLRRYTRELYLDRIGALKDAVPGLTLSTDIIVGFPGETDDDFAQTLTLVREAGFVAAFVFKYSPRPYTPALKLGDDVPEDVKDARIQAVLAAIEVQQGAHLASLVGSEQEVLIEGKSPKGERYTGRTGRHEIVHVAAPEGVDPTGQLVRVEVESALKHSLLGRMEGALALPHPPRASRRLPLLDGKGVA